MSDDNVLKFGTPINAQAQRDIADALASGATVNIEGTPVEITPDGLGFQDMEAAMNMRLWLQHACEAKGAKVVGSGYGFGAGDLDLEIEGFRYNVSIRSLS